VGSSESTADTTRAVSSGVDCFEDDYEVSEKVLGRGVNGQVYEGLCKRTGKVFAIKSFEVKELKGRQLENLAREVEILSSTEHPRVVGLEAMYESEANVHLVMERLQGGDLFDRLMSGGVFGEPDAAHIAVQVLQALTYLHTRKILHRDLKPENVMFKESDGLAIKLIDFGLSCRREPGVKLTQMCGTLQYIAPEVLQRHGYDEKSDMWSFGGLVYTLMTNKVLYCGSDSLIAKKNRLGAVDFSRAFKSLSEGARSFVLALLRVDPLSRLSALEALEHPWLRQHAPEAVEAALADAHGDALGRVKCTRPRAQLRLHTRPALVSALTGMAGEQFWSVLSDALNSMKKRMALGCVA